MLSVQFGAVHDSRFDCSVLFIIRNNLRIFILNMNFTTQVKKVTRGTCIFLRFNYTSKTPRADTVISNGLPGIASNSPLKRASASLSFEYISYAFSNFWVYLVSVVSCVFRLLLSYDGQEY